LKIFGSDFVGVTAENNSDPALVEMMRKFRIYASKIELDKEGEDGKDGKDKLKNAYTIDHTVLTYLMDDNNNFVTHLGSNLGENDLAHTIIESILGNERAKLNQS